MMSKWLQIYTVDLEMPGIRTGYSPRDLEYHLQGAALITCPGPEASGNGTGPVKSSTSVAG